MVASRILLGAAFCAFSCSAKVYEPPTVTLDVGVYQGVETNLATNIAIVHKYLGVPYTDKVERFEPAKPVPTFTGVHNATTLMKSCVQQWNYPKASRDFITSIFNVPVPEESEDCLYLNVFAPASAANGTASQLKKALKPVMFWIHGGGLMFGTAILPTYDGSSFAAHQDVIIVAPNYRTNIFGFPGNRPEIELNQRNLGLLDQRYALQWTVDNIERFGGDPNRITIFGESAGAGSAHNLMLNPPKPVPFVAAILESGTATGTSSKRGLFPSELGNGTDAWGQLAQALNCTAGGEFECIQKADALVIKDIIEKQSLSFQPVADNVTTTPDADAAIKQHTQANVPLMLGSNWNEYRVFQAQQNAATPQPTVQEYVNSSLPIPGISDAIISAYTPGNNNPWKDDFEAVSQIVTDLTFTCPAARVARLNTEAGNVVWRYLYNISFPNTAIFNDSGAYHASEMFSVFGNFVDDPQLPPPSDAQKTLSYVMQTAWANFAKNPADGPGWSKVDATAAPVGEFGGPENTTGLVEMDPKVEMDANCKIFEPLYGL